MPKAIVIHETGGPDVLKFEEVEIGRPGPGEALIEHKAIGLNFIDVYFRTGYYPSKVMPFTPGGEGAGVVLAVGEGVTLVKPGDRVAYFTRNGAYAEQRIIAADQLVKLPEAISFEEGAALMLKGMTAEYLLRRTFRVKPGDTILCHAAAGGVGLIVGQWAKHLGCTVIGTASSPEKMALAKAHGYDHVIDYRKDDFVAAVKEITGGRKCDVVYDSVGKDTFPGSLDCIRPLGMFVSFGQSSGALPPLDLGMLVARGSLFATRPTLFAYVANRADLEMSSAAVFDVVTSGAVKIEINQRYPLRDAWRAHTDLEARRTTGTTVLLP